MSKHATVSSLLAAWTVNACDPIESDAVDNHLRTCETCRAEARDLINAAERLTKAHSDPPKSLRDKVLNVTPALHAYAATVSALDALLHELTPDQWNQVAHGDWTIRDLVVHLTATDNLVADRLGLPVDPPVYSWEDPDSRTDLLLSLPGDHDSAWLGWRRQAQAISRCPADDDLLAARAFETWLHAGDIALATRKALPAPPADHLHTIADFTARLLPHAAKARRLPCDGNTLRLILTGNGGGTWTLPLSDEDLGATVEMTMNVIEFCMLLGGRREPRTVDVMIRGDVELGYDLLDAAPTVAPR